MQISFPPTLPLFTFYTKPISPHADKSNVFIIAEDFLSSSFTFLSFSVTIFVRVGKRKKLFFGPSNMAAILDASLFQGHWT